MTCHTWQKRVTFVIIGQSFDHDTKGTQTDCISKKHACRLWQVLGIDANGS